MALVSVLPSEELELKEKSSERSLDLKNRRCLGSFSTLLIRNCLNICLRRRRRERDVNHHAYKCTPAHKHTPMINLLFNRARSKQSIDSHLSRLSNPPSALPGLQKEERKKIPWQAIKSINRQLKHKLKGSPHLCVGAGVPVRIINENSISPDQVHSKTTDSCCQNEQEN